MNGRLVESHVANDHSRLERYTYKMAMRSTDSNEPSHPHSRIRMHGCFCNVELSSYSSPKCINNFLYSTFINSYFLIIF